MENSIAYWKIIAYCKNELSESERLILEQSLLKDKEAWELVLFIEELKQKGELDNFLNYNKKLFETKLKPNNKGFFLFSNFRFSIAAIITLFCIISICYLIFQSNKNNNDYFSEYYNPYQPTTLVRSFNKNIQSFDSLILQAYNDYEQKEYDKVIKNLENILLENQHPQAELVLSNAYILTGREEDALKWLKRVEDSQSPDYTVYALWYEGLIALKNGEVSKAKEYLKRIKRHPSKFGKNATIILNELE
jgi:tetratricopeptide (TPR) repeat protein